MFELQLCGRRTGIKWYMLLFECMSKWPSIVCVPILKYPFNINELIIYGSHPPPLLTRLPRTPALACVWNPRIHGNLFECSAGNGRSKGFQSGCFACPTRIVRTNYGVCGGIPPLSSQMFNCPAWAQSCN